MRDLLWPLQRVGKQEMKDIVIAYSKLIPQQHCLQTNELYFTSCPAQKYIVQLQMSDDFEPSQSAL